MWQFIVVTALILIANALAALVMVALGLCILSMLGSSDEWWPLWILAGVVGVVIAWMFLYMAIDPRPWRSLARALARLR